jgi:multidrug efflux pump subunit AcrB
MGLDYGPICSFATFRYTHFVRMKPWEERHSDALHVRGIMASLQRQVANIPEAIVFPFNIPTISGFGASGKSRAAGGTDLAAGRVSGEQQAL